MSTDVLAFGPVFLEVVFGEVPALPGPGEEVYASEFAISCGGAVSVAAATAATGAGAAVATVLGTDAGSRVVEDFCARVGVDLSPSRRVEGESSGVTAVLNGGEDRAFLSYLPPAGGFAHSPEWWAEVVASVRPTWIYVHARPGTMPVIEAAQAVGSMVAVDTELDGIATDPDGVADCARAADVFVPNRRELLTLADRADPAEAVETLGLARPLVVVKEGAAGARVFRAGRQVFMSPPAPSAVVRDCTGAGDAFAGAFLGILTHGGELETAVAEGNRAGAAAVARLGAVGPVGGPSLLGDLSRTGDSSHTGGAR